MKFECARKCAIDSWITNFGYLRTCLYWLINDDDTPYTAGHSGDE